MAYSSTKLAKRLLPEILDITKAITSATAPKLADRDPRELMAYLERLLVADPRLAGHVTVRTAALAAYPWKITPRTEADAESAAQAEDACAAAVDDLILTHMEPVNFGVSLARVDWTLDAGLWIPNVGRQFTATEIERVDDPAFPDGVAILEESAGGKFTRIAPFDTNEQTYVPARDGREIGGLLRKLVIGVKLLDMNLQDWSNFNKKLKGLIVAKYREGADATDQSIALAAVQALGASNAAVTSDAVSYEFQRFVDALGKDSYKEFKESLVADIAVAFLGQANTAELPSGGGSRAALEVLDLIRTDILIMDLMRVQRMINRHLLRTYYSHQIAKLVPARLPWKFEFVQEEREDFEANARTIETLRRSGVRLKLSEVYAKTGFTEPAATDAVLEPEKTTDILGGF